MVKFEQHIPVTVNDTSIVPLLHSACSNSSTPLSINQLKSAIQKGALWLTRNNKIQRLRKLKKTLLAGDTLHFYYDENVLQQVPLPAQLIADLHHYSIWYKPYGMLSQGSKWSDHCTIARWVEAHLAPQRPAFVVHRLDRAASGLIIIAHSKQANKAFSHLFEQHLLDKRYHILVHGQFTRENNQDALVVQPPIDDKQAKSTFYPLSYCQQTNISLLAVKIDSGRKHQIRKHAASIGYPVVGDRLHGDKSTLVADIDLQLCAISLAFDCPLTNTHQQFLLPEQLRPQLTALTAKLAKTK